MLAKNTKCIAIIVLVRRVIFNVLGLHRLGNRHFGYLVVIIYVKNVNEISDFLSYHVFTKKFPKKKKLFYSFMVLSFRVRSHNLQ